MGNNNLKNDKELLFKSLGHAEVITESLKDIMDYEEFISNPTLIDIVLLHLSQIGELCKRFTQEFKDSYNNIDFRAIAGLRDIVIHDYSGINYNEIYNTIKYDIPILLDNYRNI